MNDAGHICGVTRTPQDPAVIHRIAANLRTIRLSKNMSQETVAYNAGVSLSQIHRLENGKINPSIMTLYRIASALDVSIHLLLAENPDHEMWDQVE